MYVHPEVFQCLINLIEYVNFLFYLFSMKAEINLSENRVETILKVHVSYLIYHTYM